jgi:hypothetical protein
MTTLVRGKLTMTTNKEILQERRPLSLEEQFNQIRGKYEFFHSNEQSYIQWHIMTTARSIPSFEKVAIWGAGVHTTKLLEYLGNIVPISFIVDSDPSKQGTEMMGFEVKGPEAIESENISIVIVSALHFRDEIKKTIDAQYTHVKIIDFYDVYNGIIFMDEIIPFYADHFFNARLDIHMLRTRIELEKDATAVEALYKWLLSYLLDYKEFEQFDLVVQQYVKTGYSDAEHLVNLNADIENLLHHAKEAIRQRKQRDIILLVFDGMRQRDVTLCPSLKTMADQSVVFQNAFSYSTYTKRCYMGMFNGSALSGEGFFTGNVDGSKSSFIQCLENKKYSLFQYAGPGLENINKLNHMKLGKMSLLSYHWWNVIDQLYSLQTPQLHLIHVMETHYPFLCSKHEGMINIRYNPVDYLKGNGEMHKESTAQYKEVLSFVDNKLKDIRSFISGNTMMVVCSDHGSANGGAEPTGHLMKCKDEYIHIPFMIHHKDLIPETYDELFSMTNFDSMMATLIETGNVDESLFSSEVIAERDSIYKTGWLLNPVFVKNLGVWIHAFKMVRNRTHKYVLFENGDELLFELPDETNNLLINPQYQDILHELRSKVTSDFSNLKNYKSKKGGPND